MKIAADRLWRDRNAEDARNARAAHAHGIAPRQRAADVDQRAGAAAAEFDDQWRGAVDRRRPDGEIDAALEAVAGIGGKAEPPRLALDHRRIPERAFEEHAWSCRR